ncbi:MAG: serine/threonine-protein kinase, partial [Planctomycetota bacterium]
MNDDTLFGRIAVAKGLISEADLEGALREQARGQKAGNLRPLGAILVERGVLTPSRVREILKDQGKSLFRCLSCKTPYTLTIPPKKGTACPLCGGTIHDPGPDDLGEGSLPVKEEEGTLYVIENDPTHFSDPALRDDRSSPPDSQADFSEEGTFSGTFDAGGSLKPPPPVIRRPEPEDLAIGEVVGGCEIIRLIGRGGMGAVYEAMHIALNKRVALKVLSPHLMGHPVLIQRFLQEARTSAKLDHPNAVQVLNVGQERAVHFIVMQFVEGESLSRALDRVDRMPIRQTLRIVRQVAAGLAAAHAMGIVHRDVKPG